MPNSERFMSVKIFLIFWCGIVGTKIAVSGFKLYLSIIIYVTIWLLLVVHQWYFMVRLNEMNWKVLFLGQFVFTTTSNWESAISTFPIIATNEFSSSQVYAACFSMAASEEKWVVSYSRKSWGSDQTRPTQVENYFRQSSPHQLVSLNCTVINSKCLKMQHRQNQFDFKYSVLWNEYPMMIYWGGLPTSLAIQWAGCSNVTWR